MTNATRSCTLYKRQKVLLGLLQGARKELTRLELMKMLFLLKAESCLSAEAFFYDFVPYQYGPFSFAAYHDLRTLARLDYVDFSDESRRTIPVLCPERAREAFESLPARIRAAVSDTLDEYGMLSQESLVDAVYRRHPWFASRSRRCGAQGAKPANPPDRIHTAGYEGESIDAFLQKLLKNAVERLIDVRSNPLSRKYGFSKGSLAQLCAKVGIEYIHVPEAGIPSAYRTALRSYEDYQALLRRYERVTLKEIAAIREELAKLVRERLSALVCFEADVSCCHRSVLANALSMETGIGVHHL